MPSSRRNENTIGCRSIDRSFRRICGEIRAKGDRKIGRQLGGERYAKMNVTIHGERRYDEEWVLIAYTDLGENLKPIAGEVIAHSIDRQLRILGD